MKVTAVIEEYFSFSLLKISRFLLCKRLAWREVGLFNPIEIWSSPSDSTSKLQSSAILPKATSFTPGGNLQLSTAAFKAVIVKPGGPMS